MRLSLLVLLALTTLPAEAQSADTTRASEELANAARSFQRLYMGGADEDCDGILAAIDDDVVFQENGKVWTREELAQFCPHLPFKDVIDSTSSHEILTDELAYDFVSELYWGANRKDTFRETISRVWRRSDGAWKIVHMDVARSQVLDED